MSETFFSSLCRRCSSHHVLSISRLPHELIGAGSTLGFQSCLLRNMPVSIHVYQYAYPSYHASMFMQGVVGGLLSGIAHDLCLWNPDFYEKPHQNHTADLKNPKHTTYPDTLNMKSSITRCSNTQSTHTVLTGHVWHVALGKPRAIDTTTWLYTRRPLPEGRSLTRSTTFIHHGPSSQQVLVQMTHVSRC